jgi:hypothetical protein
MEKSFKLITPHRFLTVFLTGLFATSGAQALSIAFEATTLSASAGSTVSFTGRISNDTPSRLNVATDLFHNFSSYSAVILTPLDLLPTQSGSIEIGNASSLLSLFSVTVAAGTAPGVYALQASVQDIFGLEDVDFSAVYDVSVNVTSPIPEPDIAWLLLLGLPLMGAVARHRKKLNPDSNALVSTRVNIRGATL